MTEENTNTVDSASMPVLEHLAELRVRLVRIVIAILIAAIVSYFWADELFAALTRPIRISFANLHLIGTGPAEAFLVKLKAAFAAGIVISAPVSFFEIWRFIAPGLHLQERKLAMPFVFFSTVFFLAGVAFCYALVLPTAFTFFSGEFASVGVTPQIRISEYLTFALKLILIFGVVFELPVLTYVLARLRIVSSQWMTRNLRIAIVAIFIVAAIVTPPDVISQLLLAGPLLLLYAVCIGVCRFVERDRTAVESAPPAG